MKDSDNIISRSLAGGLAEPREKFWLPILDFRGEGFQTILGKDLDLKNPILKAYSIN